MKEKTETKTTHNPHDRGYKKSLSHPKEFLHFLKKYVGADWMMDLTESQLSLCDKELVPVSDCLRETIRMQQDISILKIWHKQAARVSSINEFESFLNENSAKS